MTRTLELLQKRKIKSLRGTIFFRLAIFFIYSILIPFTTKSRFESIMTLSICLLILIIELFSLYFLYKKKFLNIIGFAGAILDAFIITVLPIIWYISVGGKSVLPAFMIKGPMYYAYLFLFLCLNTLAVEPNFILVNTIGGVLSQVGHFLYIFFEGRTVFTTDYTAHNLSNEVSYIIISGVLIIYIIIGIISYFFVKGIKKTVFTAVKNETESAQLSRYFSPKIRDKIISEESTNPIGEGHLQNVVVLFSDIRDFTSYCEKNSPKDVVEFLKVYHSYMVNAIFKYGGTLDKFIGDGIMATFGTPTASSGDILNSVKAAVEMSKSLNEINEERLKKGLKVIKHGIGIHYGQAIVGNVGSEDRMEYTVIGDTVNTASRIESCTKKLNEEILISSNIKEKLNNQIETEIKGEINLKGKTEPVKLFSVNLNSI